MPIPIARKLFAEGLDSVPLVTPILNASPWLALLALLKWFFGGAGNTSEGDMHGKVLLVTGGTSGIGEALVRDLARRGAQIVLLTQHTLSDPFLVEFVEDLRVEAKNQLITAAQVDLRSLHSVRQFATKWIDNAPPRRLDMVVLCANTIGTVADARAGKKEKETQEGVAEGVEMVWQVNYLANFHLLSILSPALRAQPPDRDVRILFGTCSSYVGGDLLHITQPPANRKKDSAANDKSSTLIEPTRLSPSNAYATSKLALTTFALAFQKHLSSYARPDKFPMNTKVLLVDPGMCRTPGTRRWLSWGSLFGLLLYLAFYPLWWLVLKSPFQGAQSFLYAAMEGRFARLRQDLDHDFKDGDAGGWYIKECAPRLLGREDVKDEEVQKRLWEHSERMIEEAEKRGAAWRAREKKQADEKREEDEAEREIREYKEKIGKKEGQKEEGSRRARKAG